VAVSKDSRGLRRDLGLLDATGIGFGAIVGAGIFVVTGIAAGIAGPAFLIGLFVAALVATANALSSAQLAAEYPQAGGAYEYGYRVLHPLLGFAAGWMYFVSKISAAGTVALGLAGYLEALRPGAPARAVAVLAILAFTAVSYFGVKRSSRVNLAMVCLSVGSLLLFVVAGLESVRADNFRAFAPAGLSGILESSALLFFAYTGYARIATLAEEVREPKHTIPRAIVLTIGGAVALYAGVAVVAVGTIGAPALAATSAPLYRAAATFPHAWVAGFVAIGGLVAMFGVVLSQLLGLSRMVFAMSRRGDLPVFLSHIDPHDGVPRRAVLLVGGAAALAAATGALEDVASSAAFSILVYYGIANLAALRMQARAKLYSDLVPLFGLFACLLLAFSLTLPTVTMGMAMLLAGFAVRRVAGLSW
jgi:basic amino acid/polyamine antiporter, APA family